MQNRVLIWHCVAMAFTIPCTPHHSLCMKNWKFESGGHQEKLKQTWVIGRWSVKYSLVKLEEKKGEWRCFLHEKWSLLWFSKRNYWFSQHGSIYNVIFLFKQCFQEEDMHEGVIKDESKNETWVVGKGKVIKKEKRSWSVHGTKIIEFSSSN